MQLFSYIHWLPVAVGFLLFCASMAGGLSAWRRCATISNSRSWPAIKADVTYTDIDSHYDSHMEVTVYSPKVWYSYQVDTDIHEGQIELPTSANRDAAEEIRAPYREGRSLVLRYDPRNPRRAVVEGQTVRLRDIGMVAIAIVTGLIGVGLMTSSLFDR